MFETNDYNIVLKLSIPSPISKITEFALAAHNAIQP